MGFAGAALLGHCFLCPLSSTCHHAVVLLGMRLPWCLVPPRQRGGFLEDQQTDGSASCQLPSVAEVLQDGETGVVLGAGMAPTPCLAWASRGDARGHHGNAVLCSGAASGGCILPLCHRDTSHRPFRHFSSSILNEFCFFPQ